jgi:hypothetical protein
MKPEYDELRRRVDSVGMDPEAPFTVEVHIASLDALLSDYDQLLSTVRHLRRGIAEQRAG